MISQKSAAAPTMRCKVGLQRRCMKNSATSVAFVGIKLYFEYYRDWLEGTVPGLHWTLTSPRAPQVELFMCFYFFMTMMHALHMIVGFGIMTVLIVMAAKGRLGAERYNPVEMAGLYWHFVDIIWIFLFPLLYLVGGRY